jgi:hypothetical protein
MSSGPLETETQFGRHAVRRPDAAAQAGGASGAAAGRSPSLAARTARGPLRLGHDLLWCPHARPAGEWNRSARAARCPLLRRPNVRVLCGYLTMAAPW